MGIEMSKRSELIWDSEEHELESGYLHNRTGDLCARSSSSLPTLLSPWMGDTCSKKDNAFPAAWKKQAVPDDTLIIFDWDDTLLCSSALNFGEWSPGQLLHLEKAVESILETAMNLGETMIVTNGNDSWVADSSREFVPGLCDILRCVPVLSARAAYEKLHPGDPVAWKRHAFRDVITARRQRGCDLNLVVIGDSPAEIEAARSAQRVGVVSRVSLVKTVKFKVGPTVNELLGQLRRCELELESLVKTNSSASRGLVQRQLPVLSPSLDRLASWPSRWRLEETDDSADLIMAFKV